MKRLRLRSNQQSHRRRQREPFRFAGKTLCVEGDEGRAGAAARVVQRFASPQDGEGARPDDPAVAVAACGRSDCMRPSHASATHPHCTSHDNGMSPARSCYRRIGFGQACRFRLTRHPPAATAQSLADRNFACEHRFPTGPVESASTSTVTVPAY